MAQTRITCDGNEAAARIAYLASEVCGIYPITPASPMGEHADAWAANGKENAWGTVPMIIEMQSEGGAAGAVHGSLAAGALTSTFTASQGLLLKVPNMFKIAGELTPTVFHIAARSIATHALSIFGDHSDVMAARSTGFAMLFASTVQEAHDMALIAHMATLESRVPFLHIFDGFRTSHEVNGIMALDAEDVRALIPETHIVAHRARGLNPDRPEIHGTAQNPDVFFQAREACNPYYDATAAILQGCMDRFAARAGRQYRLFEYHGHPEAERVAVLMGSGTLAAIEAAEALVKQGEKVGVLVVRAYRPFATQAFLEALPDTTTAITVLDRTKEPGAPGEPLYLDVVAALAERGGILPTLARGRFGLSSKEFTPAMVKGVFENLAADVPKRQFTVGIYDDVTHLSLPWDETFDVEPDDVTRAVFWGLGSDGTVGAAKNTVKIISEQTALNAQGYFVYDSKKSGARTISHVRISPNPVTSPYLISHADFVACHQFDFLEKYDVLAAAKTGATFLLNSPFGVDETWDKLPYEVQQTLVDKALVVYVVDAAQVAKETGMGLRINTIMQACFFELSGFLPREEAIRHIKSAIEKTYYKRGRAVVDRNFAAVDGARGALKKLAVPSAADSPLRINFSAVADAAPDFVKRVTAMIMAGNGDRLPVSAMPIDGTFPSGTTQYDKRGIAHEIPIWDPDICTQCGICAIVCPHAAIRIKTYEATSISDAPEGFLSRAWRSKDLPAGTGVTIQVAPDDCTGCGVCVDMCPARSKTVAKHKAINMTPKWDHLEVERRAFDYFLSIPESDRKTIDFSKVKTSQRAQPLFEFSGACAGCGETPYLKILTQLFGPRMVVANATGCSSIYGGNLPTHPWGSNGDGRGPAWSNSLFEDNAEFGLGMRMAVDAQTTMARNLVSALSGDIGEAFAEELLTAPQTNEAEYEAQWARVATLKETLSTLESADAQRLLSVADTLVTRSVWIIGGDGWAYDIGFGGLDHVLASGKNVNVIVLDTEVYSNTGGQASKATPRGAVAKFAANGKPNGKKDLGMIAAAYGNVYVAQVALGANPKQVLTAFREAEAWDGPSLIIAYSTCIAHGIDMTTSMSHQKDAVRSGYWPLYRFRPSEADGTKPFKLDCRAPTIPFKEFAMQEARFAFLARSKPEHAAHLMNLAQSDIDTRRAYYEQLADVERLVPHETKEEA